jgi:methionine-rich copper-binding protein CopC
MSRSRVRHVLAVVLAVVVVGVLAGAVAAPAPAAAHGTLVTSTPAHGSTVTDRVETVLLTFTEKPAPFAHFTVTAPTGVRVDAGWSNGEPVRLAQPVREFQLKDGKWQPLLYHTGFPVTVNVSHWPAAGPYVVTYHNVASDGDTVKGEVRFAFHGAVVPAPPGWQAPTDQPRPELLAAGHQEPSARPSPPVRAAQAQPPDDTTVWVWLVPVLLVVAVALSFLLIAPHPWRRGGRGRIRGSGSQ